MRKFLFPISLSNNLFSTERVVSGLNAIPEAYDEVVFIIADQIQLYNRALYVKDSIGLEDMFRKFYGGSTLFEQRRNWLNKLKKELDHSGNFPLWTIYSLDDIADRMLTRIYRNILIMYHAMAEFRLDVNSQARRYLSKRLGAANVTNDNIQLSASYILEEMAASIRLHVCEDIGDEYYLGKHLNCVLRLYSSVYGPRVFSIAGVEPKSIEWRFFDSLTRSDQARWVKRRL